LSKINGWFEFKKNIDAIISFTEIFLKEISLKEYNYQRLLWRMLWKKLDINLKYMESNSIIAFILSILHIIIFPYQNK